MDQQSVLMAWIEKGGAFGVIALLLYFYRRDWSTLTQYWQQQNTLLMEIVRTNTTELRGLTENLKANHAEVMAGNEAVRTRLHELSQPLNTMAGVISTIAAREHIGGKE